MGVTVVVGVTVDVGELVGVGVEVLVGDGLGVVVTVGVLLAVGVAVLVGGVPTKPLAYSEPGEFVQLDPPDQAVGRLLSAACMLVCDFVPLTASRYRTVPAPVGLSNASQYLLPAETAAAGTDTVFHALRVGFIRSPWVRRLAGLVVVALFEYSPRTMCVAALAVST